MIVALVEAVFGIVLALAAFVCLATFAIVMRKNRPR